MNPRSATGLSVQRRVLSAAGALSSMFGGLVGKLSGPPSEVIELPDYRSAA